MSGHTPAYREVDLTTCDLEPIHVPGAVQPHGVLLAVDTFSRVVSVSANCTEYLGSAPAELIGEGLAVAVGDEAAGAISHYWRAGDLNEPLPLVLDLPRGHLAGVLVDVVLHTSGEHLLVEVEPLSTVAATSPVSYRSARAAVARLNQTGSVKELFDRLAREIRAFTAFDRVMVYRFDEMWNGEVVAEDRRDDLNSFLGLHYPASDIPVQARRLYTINWTRLIADIGYSPVPLVPVRDPATGQPLDLSHSVLRSVSPIHIEYLSHMGVTASMSVSLVSDGVLRGLVACHHYSGAHRPAYDARSAAEQLAHTASQLLDERERSELREDALAAKGLLIDIMSSVTQDGRTPLEALIADPRLLSLVGASGAAAWSEGTMLTVGEVPPTSTLRRISRLLDHDDGAPTSSDHLAALDDRLQLHAGVAAGAMRIGIGPDRWLLWVRPEREKVVDWGGDPTNKILAAAEGPAVRMSPRRSFAKWREVVHCHSDPWTEPQHEAGDSLRSLISSLMLRRSRDQISIAESLQRSVVLSETPSFDGLDVVGRYRPAEGGQLGGDWWDAFELADGRVAFVVGDVAGHGVLAATTMTQLRTALRAYMAEGHSAAVAIDHLDQMMSTMLPGRTATVIMAVVDPRSRLVELTSAGHPAPVLVTAGGASVVDMNIRPLVGMGAGVATTVPVVVEPGDVVLLYSDGLVERRDTPIDATLEQFSNYAAHDRGATTLDAWADDLLTAVPGTENDDTTLVVVHFQR